MKTFVKILKRSDQGLTVCPRSGTSVPETYVVSGDWELSTFNTFIESIKNLSNLCYDTNEKWLWLSQLFDEVQLKAIVY